MVAGGFHEEHLFAGSGRTALGGGVWAIGATAFVEGENASGVPLFGIAMTVLSLALVGLLLCGAAAPRETSTAAGQSFQAVALGCCPKNGATNGARWTSRELSPAVKLWRRADGCLRRGTIGGAFACFATEFRATRAYKDVDSYTDVFS